MENHLGKTTHSSPDQDSNLNLPVLSSRAAQNNKHFTQRPPERAHTRGGNTCIQQSQCNWCGAVRCTCDKLFKVTVRAFIVGNYVGGRRGISHPWECYSFIVGLSHFGKGGTSKTSTGRRRFTTQTCGLLSVESGRVEFEEEMTSLKENLSLFRRSFAAAVLGSSYDLDEMCGKGGRDPCRSRSILF
uniref:Uncharacterized protein n=1 Tax=Timema shepardi TaxID=629360 RepID=A0A7R9FZ34_TIMSH|nr:unnamed protein product [Timema shepardi]